MAESGRSLRVAGAHNVHFRKSRRTVQRKPYSSPSNVLFTCNSSRAQDSCSISSVDDSFSPRFYLRRCAPFLLKPMFCSRYGRRLFTNVDRLRLVLSEHATEDTVIEKIQAIHSSFVAQSQPRPRTTSTESLHPFCMPRPRPPRQQRREQPRAQ